MADWYGHGNTIGIGGGTALERLCLAVTAACDIAGGIVGSGLKLYDERQHFHAVIVTDDMASARAMVEDWIGGSREPMELTVDPTDEGSTGFLFQSAKGTVAIKDVMPKHDPAVIVFDLVNPSWDIPAVWTLGRATGTGSRALVSPDGRMARLSIRQDPRSPVLCCTRLKDTPDGAEDATTPAQAHLALFMERVRPLLEEKDPTLRRKGRTLPLRDVLKDRLGRKWYNSADARMVLAENPCALSRVADVVPASMDSLARYISRHKFEGLTYTFKDGSSARIPRMRARHPARITFSPGKDVAPPVTLPPVAAPVAKSNLKDALPISMPPVAAQSRNDAPPRPKITEYRAGNTPGHGYVCVIRPDGTPYMYGEAYYIEKFGSQDLDAFNAKQHA